MVFFSVTYCNCSLLQTPPQQFITFPYSLLKTISMTIGELETDPIFFSTPSVIVYPVVTYFLWIVFLVIMPVLLQNLLVWKQTTIISALLNTQLISTHIIVVQYYLNAL